MFCVDIDWADQKHDICVVDEKGERVVNFTIPHTAQGLSRLHHHLSILSPNRDELLVALETDKGLVVSFLLDLGYPVYPINPKVVSRYRDRYRTSGAKSDPLDALVLANKWVKVIFTLRQKRKNYDESFHLWDKARYTLKARTA